MAIAIRAFTPTRTRPALAGRQALAAALRSRGARFVFAGLTAAAALAAPPMPTRADARRAAVTATLRAELATDAANGFATRDRDHDGALTPAEVPHLGPATWHRLDRNADGRVTPAEARPDPATLHAAAVQAEASLSATFRRLDANADGRLDAREAPLLAAGPGAPATGVSYEGFPDALQRLNAAAAAPAATATSRNPVLMMPGFIMPASSFAVMRRTLAAAGYAHFEVLDRWPWFADIRESALEARDLADRLRERAGTDKVELLGHSMGGLVGRYMMQTMGYEGLVDHYVSFGTPHHGTLIAPLANLYAFSTVQMTPGSPFLRALNRHEGRPSPVKYTSVHAEHDEIVWPAESADLAGAANPTLPGSFHIGIVYMPELAALVVETLAR